MTFYRYAERDESHRRKPFLTVKLCLEEEGCARIRIVEELKVPELPVVL
jgi:hypothetical protein